MAGKSGTLPEVGVKAPSFNLPSTKGGRVRLADLKGKPLVLYFYPKDNTPGCTIEAKEFRDQFAAFEAFGAVVVGVSPDCLESHCGFADRYKLNFVLLADTDHSVAEKYGVWVKKKLYGRTYWGVQRSTFLIDKSGKIAGMWEKVKPEGHAQEVLDAVKAL